MEIDLPRGAVPSPEPADEQLTRLYGEYIDRLIAGESLDPARILTEHPDIGRELVERLVAFQEVGSETSDGNLQGTLGDYRLMRQIGRGGMGVVYEAWQGSMDRRVALKVLPAGIAADNHAFVRFMREARTAGRLNHANIVAVHGMGIESDTPYYAMEYVEGETLAQVLARMRSASEASPTPFGAARSDQQIYLHIARAFEEVADGLQHAHSKGVVHRDIKPSNLILDGERRLRILDFGLARIEGQQSLTLTSDCLGTPLYMSPEQARRRKIPVDYRTDIYSLGATLYETLVLSPPFLGKDHEDTLSQIVHRDPRPLRSLHPQVPADLERIVLKCLRKEPEDRYATAEALAQDLRRFVRGDPVEARPQPAWLKLRRSLLRQKWRVLAALLVVLLLVTSGLLFRHYRAEEARAALDRYRRAVVDSVLMLQLGEMTARAGSPGPAAIDPQDLFLPGDFEALAQDAEFNPLWAAVERLRKAAEVLPERPEAHYHIARALVPLGDRAGALASVRLAVDLAPAFVPARLLLEEISGAGGEAVPTAQGWGGKWLAARKAIEKREWKEAAALYDELIREPPGVGKMYAEELYLGSSVEFYLERGRALLEAGDGFGAIECFVGARTLWPEATVPQLLLGRAYCLKGEKERTETIFRALHRQAGDRGDEIALWVAALYKSSREYERGLEWAEAIGEESLRLRLQVDFNCLLGSFGEAVRLGREAIQKFPEDGRTHHFLTVALLKDPKSAAEGLQVALRAAKLDPRRADTLSLLAVAYHSNGELQKAEEVFLQAIEIDPNGPRGYDHLGGLLMRAGRLKEAEQRFREAIRIVEKNPRVHFLAPHVNLGNLFLSQGKIEEAIRAFRRAVEFDPQLPFGYYNLGAILKRLGRLDEAEANLTKAIEIQPRNPKAIRFLALVHLLQEEPERAIEEFREALRIEPRYLSAAADLGLALEGLEREDESFLIYLDALRKRVHERLWHERLVALQEREPGGDRYSTGWDQVAEVLKKDIESGPAKPGILHTLAVALTHGKERRNREEALALASRAVEETRRGMPDFLSTLAEIEFLRGEQEKAVLLLEEAVRLPQARAAHKHRLDAYRRELSARVLVRTSDRLESLDRQAESLVAAGRPEEAERMLRGAVETDRAADRQLWSLWTAISFRNLGRSPEELLAAFPVGGGPVGGDIRWLLERLAAGEAIRLNCGGEEYRSPLGIVWGRDRFHFGGARRPPVAYEIAGTEEDPLFQSARWFPREGLHRAYGVPLPPGRYRVSLHFAEIALGDRFPRAFDVLMEGERVLTDHDPLKAGFAVAQEHGFSISVQDGVLDIQFIPRREDGIISAIEIRREDEQVGR